MGAPPGTKLSNCTIREVRYEQKEYFLTHLWCHFNKIIAFIHKQPLTPIKQELRNRSCRSLRALKRRTGSRVTYDPKWLGMQLITSSQITSVWSDVTGETIIVWCCFFRLLCHLWVNHKQGTGFSSQDMSGIWLETKWETPRTTGSVSRIFINELQLIYCRPAFGQNFCNLVLKFYFNFFCSIWRSKWRILERTSKRKRRCTPTMKSN